MIDGSCIFRHVWDPVLLEERHREDLEAFQVIYRVLELVIGAQVFLPPRLLALGAVRGGDAGAFQAGDDAFTACMYTSSETPRLKSHTNAEMQLRGSTHWQKVWPQVENVLGDRKSSELQ